MIRVAPAKRPPDDCINRLTNRRNQNIAAVAVANRNVRIAWALLTRKEDYKPPENRHAPAVVPSPA